MRRKSERELAAVREACATLDMAIAAMGTAQRTGKSATDTILAGEYAAHKRGAQDVRTLFSLDGGRTLRPFETLVDRAVDPLQVYVAIRQQGYWAEGFALLSASPVPRVAQVAEVLASAVAMIEPGKPCTEVARAIAQGIGSARLHPISAHVQGNAIGLGLAEHPLIATDSEDTFHAGDVFSLRVGVAEERGGAIVSAMVAVGERGCDVLWPAPLPEN
jgi:Xaa-Pro aminopeptidase